MNSDVGENDDQEEQVHRLENPTEVKLLPGNGNAKIEGVNGEGDNAQDGNWLVDEPPHYTLSVRLQYSHSNHDE